MASSGLNDAAGILEKRSREDATAPPRLPPAAPSFFLRPSIWLMLNRSFAKLQRSHPIPSNPIRSHRISHHANGISHLLDLIWSHEIPWDLVGGVQSRHPSL